MADPGNHSTPFRPLAWLAGGQVVVMVAGLVYGKAVAVMIAPREWGKYSLLLVAMTLLSSVLITPLIQSFKAALTTARPAAVVGYYAKMMIGLYALAFFLVSTAVLIVDQSPLYLLVWVVAVGQGFYTFSNDFLNVSAQYRTLSFLQMGYALSNVLFFGVVCGLGGRANATGLWWTMALLNLLFAALSAGQCFRHEPDFRLHWHLPAQRSLSASFGQYVWPLVGLGFWNGLLTYADRYLIRYFMNDTDVGHYTMGYSVGAKILVLSAPFITYLTPAVFRRRKEGLAGEESNALLCHSLKRYWLVAATACLLFFIAREPIGLVLLAERYRPAFLIGPIIAAGYLFLASIHVLEIKWYAYGQTHLILIHNVVGAVLNISLNCVLIPWLGIVGAAIATLVGFMGQLGLVFVLFYRQTS